MRTLAVVVIGVVAGLGLVACGDDSSSTLTKSEFDEEANAVCEEHNDAIDAGAEVFLADVPSGENPSEKEMNAFVNGTLVPNVQDEIDAIRDLDAPEDIQDELDATLDDAQAIVDQISDDPSILFSDEDPPFETIGDELTDLGLESCVE